MIGSILVPLGLLALRTAVRGTRAEPMALAVAVTSWIGAGLTLPYYGAEDFGLHGIAGRAAAGHDVGLLEVAEAVRYGPVAIVTFGLGLLGLGVGAVLAAVAVSRSAVLARFSGVAFALGAALFLPQFFLPAPARIAHGVLLGAGSVWLAVAIWRGGVSGTEETVEVCGQRKPAGVPAR